MNVLVRRDRDRGREVLENEPLPAKARGVDADKAAVGLADQRSTRSLERTATGAVGDARHDGAPHAPAERSLHVALLQAQAFLDRVKLARVDAVLHQELDGRAAEPLGTSRKP